MPPKKKTKRASVPANAPDAMDKVPLERLDLNLQHFFVNGKVCKE